MKKVTNISDQTWLKIEKSKIKPIPKWEFFVKYFGLWIFILFWVVLSGLGVATGYYMVSTNDWDLLYIPYFWIAVLLIFLMLVNTLFYKTKSGYRVEKKLVIAGWVVLSLFFGSLFSAVGMGEKVDKIMASKLSMYRTVSPLKLEVWMDPDGGRLSGTIKDVGEQQIVIDDFSGEVWIVDISRALVRGRVKLEVGQQIKIIGEMESSTNFEASEIRPWTGRIGN